MVEAYKTGKGSFKTRAKWSVEELGRGQWQVVVTEIPYQVQKSRLIEKLADVIESKKASWLADVRDESAEDIRIILEPKSKNLEPKLFMESLFKLTDLESRFSMNLNVLDANRTPRVMNLREVIQAFLDHRRVVLIRRSNFRLGKIDDRLEILNGLLIAHLNIDEVIRIVRFEGHPKAKLVDAFNLTERQAEAILNMRLRALNKLKEVELKSEHDELSKEKTDIEDLLGSETRQWSVIADQVRSLRETYSLKTEVGARRTKFEDQPDIDVDIEQAMITKEPITVVLSEKGWIRAMKGKLDSADGLKFKEGDKLAFMVPAETTDKIIMVASNGKFYTLAGDKLPGGRGNGEPIRLLVDLPDDHVPIGLFVHNPERSLLIASSEGYGFIVKEADVTALKRGGKQVLNVKGDVEALRCIEVTGDKIAVIGENRKILIYNVDEIPVMSRGKGVRLQKYKDGGLADVTTFNTESGLTFTDSSNRTHSVSDWTLLDGKRAQAGRMAPRGFARSGRFAPDKRLK